MEMGAHRCNDCIEHLALKGAEDDRIECDWERCEAATCRMNSVGGGSLGEGRKQEAGSRKQEARSRKQEGIATLQTEMRQRAAQTGGVRGDADASRLLLAARPAQVWGEGWRRVRARVRVRTEGEGQGRG